MNYEKIINFFYKKNFFSGIFHTTPYCLKKELKDCRSVLDLGCGPNSPLQYCQNIKYSVGVEAFLPYLRESRKKKLHSKYLNKRIEELDFSENDFDAVVMIEVLEHLSKKTAKKILANAEKWSKKKVIVSTPNGFNPQKVVDDNSFQKHLSGWTSKEMKKLGFKSYGLAGLKCLRKEIRDDKAETKLFDLIRFRPKFFWFIVSSLSQAFVWCLPFLAFGLFCVKNLEKKTD